MALDLRNSRDEYHVRCKWYKGEYVDKQKLKANAKPQGVFYSKDIEPFTSQSINNGNRMTRQVTGTIETRDNVIGLEQNDYVLMMGDLYLVVEATVDDESNEKHFSKRPSAVTKIRLRR